MSEAEGHPWFRPLYRRVLVTLLCACWLAFELALGGETLWLYLSGGCLAYAVWELFLRGRYPLR